MATRKRVGEFGHGATAARFRRSATEPLSRRRNAIHPLSNFLHGLLMDGRILAADLHG